MLRLTCGVVEMAAMRGSPVALCGAAAGEVPLLGELLATSAASVGIEIDSRITRDGLRAKDGLGPTCGDFQPATEAGGEQID